MRYPVELPIVIYRDNQTEADYERAETSGIAVEEDLDINRGLIVIDMEDVKIFHSTVSYLPGFKGTEAVEVILTPIDLGSYVIYTSYQKFKDIYAKYLLDKSKGYPWIGILSLNCLEIKDESNTKEG